MLLSDRTIKKLVREGKLTIDPFKTKNLGGSSLDLTLNHKMLTFNSLKGYIDSREPIDTKLNKINEEGIFLNPNKLYIASTNEYIGLPNDIVARIEGRSSLARLGVVIHSTGGFVDAGFEGTLTLEISNLNSVPVKIYPDMRIAQLTFIRQDHPSENPYGKRGKYQGQKGPTGSKIHLDFKTTEKKEGKQ